MGARMLRSSVLQPLSDLSMINKRLDTVEGVHDLHFLFLTIFIEYSELLNDTSFMGDLKRAIKGLPDIDQLISFIIHVPKKEMLKHTENSVAKVIEIKQMISTLDQLSTILRPATTELLQRIHKDTTDPRFEQLRELIDQVIDVEDVSKSAASLRAQRANAVRPGYNALLDVARRTFSEVTEDIHQLVREYEDTYQIPLKIRFNTQAAGYYLNAPSASVKPEELPQVFINVISRRKQLEFTTMQLLKLNQRVEESMTEILLMSDEIIAELMDEFRANIGIFYKVSDSIALLDLMLTFAQYSTTDSVGCKSSALLFTFFSSLCYTI
jgi:DNA mismatch repair protein MSH4